ncbi:hypothetical protein SELMODRAFT_421121 [Selaginella moellendorffii]|uniref:ATP-binding cassette transporter n=1 Tax=Selaginella moellendorffii TaxID=88036 RepID=D8SEK1_SELML|nr:putative multidrug resistance protein [Selaginella moellendorffii]EFJ17126.1 hypothetical protein SELMODRAFT_421121 [Selaginella moellendorffii]|eukprot:XP_002981644.1 putative multidrug resistance protein [Selaginella moellendorffii]
MKSKSFMTVFASYKRLFQEGDKYDSITMIFGTLGSMINGLSLPAVYTIQSHVYNNYGNHTSNANKQAIWCVYLAAISLLGAYLEVSCWIYTGHRQARRLRVKYVNCVLRQDASYFDCKISTANVIENVSADIAHVQEAVGEKLGHFIENISLFVGSVITALILAWRLALIVSPFVLVLLFPGFLYSGALSSYAKQRQASYATAGKIAEQAISSIRVVYSFVAERKTLELYSGALEESIKVDRKQGLAKGLTLGFHGLRYVVWALMTWYGGSLVAKGQANGAQILLAGSAFVVGSMALGSILQNLREIKDGQAALSRIFEVLETIPTIDIDSSKGRVLDRVEGELEFQNVIFSYPSRSELPVLDDFSLHIAPGKTTALVGKSGSGKSTVISLLERFYDPSNGKVLLDGVNIKNLQLKWYREQIGLVSQEPILFSSTIKENIFLGKENATLEEVIAAARKSDAHSFICGFPEGYETQVGIRGEQLSGGQKQRIALARALVRNPAILLLDEATSALDNESERTVQRAIQEACTARTALVIAHKLRAIESADLVAVVEAGKVVEYGSKQDLKNEGAFAEMFQLQQVEGDQSTRKGSPEKFRRKKTQEENVEDVVQTKLARKDRIEQSGKKRNDFIRLLLMNQPEWKYCLLGIAAAVSIGFLHPIFVALGADVISSFYSDSPAKTRHRVRNDAMIFAALSLVTFASNTLQHYSFGSMGAALTKRVREKMMAKILELDISWFDQEQHSSGALTSRLASSASMVRTVVSDRISLFVQTASTISVSVVASFVVSWKLAIVITSIQPVILICFYFRVTSLQDFARKAAKVQEEVSELILEGVTRHQTVAAFSSHSRIVTILESRLESLSKRVVRLSQAAGISSGIALFALFSSYALCLWYGGRLIAQGKTSFKDFLLTFYLLISTGRSLADTLWLSPDISQGKTVADLVFEILDEKPTSKSLEQGSMKNQEITGHIEFDKVSFAYPSRPEVFVLKNFSLTVEVAQTVAIAGRSGSGKSTIISLVERFYDPQLGSIEIDGRDIRKFQLASLRQQIGLVSQGPTLFAGSIGENIAYGKENASESEIMEAARTANAHGFISALPQGYCTPVGEIGTQLSGGQKQRIAIARAILKRPRILLLDEATSALDSKSESEVQRALERAMVGKTTIVVAHMLSTIKNADRIVVVGDGTVLEQGSRKELLARGKDGAFFSLVHACD